MDRSLFHIFDAYFFPHCFSGSDAICQKKLLMLCSLAAAIGSHISYHVLLFATESG